MPELKVVPIQSQQESGTNVVARLEEALAMAKAGQLDNCLVLAITNDGGVMDSWANMSHPFAVVGGLESLKMEFMSASIEQR